MKSIIESVNKEDIDKLIESCTTEENLLKCFEELAELMQATSKINREVTIDNRTHLVEEISDAAISIAIIKRIYGICDFEIADTIEAKMRRNLRRIEAQR